MASPPRPPLKHLLGIEGMAPDEIVGLLDLAETYVDLNRGADKKASVLRGRTQINLFFEPSTRTQMSFELAGKRLGADVLNMAVASSSTKKGETLIDTAMTLNAMHPDVLIVRHHDSGAGKLLSEKVNCSVINAGDGAHEHPTQALLDALLLGNLLHLLQERWSHVRELSPAGSASAKHGLLGGVGQQLDHLLAAKVDLTLALVLRAHLVQDALGGLSADARTCSLCFQGGTALFRRQLGKRVAHLFHKLGAQHEAGRPSLCLGRRLLVDQADQAGSRAGHSRHLRCRRGLLATKQIGAEVPSGRLLLSLAEIGRAHV